MSLNWPKTGPNHVPAYLASGVPFVTQSVAEEVPQVDGGSPATIKFSFPFVTRFFQVENIDSGQALRVGFSDAGVKGLANTPSNYILVGTGQKTDVLEMRCKELYFGGVGGTSGFRIIAGLTTITGSEFPELKTANGFTGV